MKSFDHLPNLKKYSKYLYTNSLTYCINHNDCRTLQKKITHYILNEHMHKINIHFK